MQEHVTYIGIEPFTVVLDDTPQLARLVHRARALRETPQDRRLSSVKDLVHEAFPVNAYEIWKAQNSEEGRRLVVKKHPLSEALVKGMACCRYQGALFFVLGLEAELGDRHFLQSARVRQGLNTVFNEVYFFDPPRKEVV